MRNANGSLNKIEQRLKNLEKLLDINRYEVHYAGEEIKITEDTVLIRLRWLDLPDIPLEKVQKVDINLSENLQ